MKKIGLLFVFVVLLALVGCGGGGSGSSGISIVLDWTNAGSSTGGQSVRIETLDVNGNLVNSTLVNQSTTAQTTTPITGLGSGTYHVSMQLFSLTNAQGVQVGSIDIYTPGSSTLKAMVGGTENSLAVSPNSATLNAGQTEQFFANGFTTANQLTFIDATTLSWSVLNNIGTIDPNQGIFNATTVGSGSVRVTQSITGLTGGAPVTVNPVNITKSTWTIMVYMNAANDLSYYSPINFEQMQSVANNPNVRIVVQWKQVPTLGYPTQFNGTRRYLVNYSTASSINSTLVQDLGTGVDMGVPTTLNSFIGWAQTYYPADHYALVVWDHGNGWNRGPQNPATRAVSYDFETGNAIQTWQLNQALGSYHFDILAWDASLMQMAEVADQVANNATYIVGGEASPPGAGYPYNLIFGKFEQNPNAPTLNLAKGFVDGMIQGYANTPGVEITQSVIDPTQLPGLMSSIKSLGADLVANNSTAQSWVSAIQTVRTNAQSYSQSATRFYRDLYDVTLDLDKSGVMPNSIIADDLAVRTAIGKAVLYEAHNASVPGSHGISIDFSPSSVFTPEAGDYGQLQMNTDTNWGAWLQVAP